MFHMKKYMSILLLIAILEAVLARETRKCDSLDT